MVNRLSWYQHESPARIMQHQSSVNIISNHHHQPSLSTIMNHNQPFEQFFFATSLSTVFTHAMRPSRWGRRQPWARETSSSDTYTGRLHVNPIIFVLDTCYELGTGAPNHAPTLQWCWLTMVNGGWWWIEFSIGTRVFSQCLRWWLCTVPVSRIVII